MPDSNKLDPSVFDPTQPTGNDDPRLGDNYLRDTKSRLYNWAITEHNPDGKHKIPVASSLPTPDATAIGRLAIKDTDQELYADITGAAFVKMTSKSEIAGLVTTDTTHAASNPADHVAGSIRHTHILAGDIKKKHLDGSGSATSIAALVNGSNADSLHSHVSGFTAQTPIVYTSSDTFIDNDALFILVETWGGGGSSNSTNSDSGSSGSGGGAYAASLIFAVGLGSVPITVATAVGPYTNGLPSSFGTYVVAGGGTKGENAGAVGTGGVASFGSSFRILSQVGVSGGDGGLYGYKCGGGGGGCAGTNGAAGIGEFGPRAGGGVGSNGGGDGGGGGYQVGGFTQGLSGITPGGGSGGCAGSTSANAYGGAGQVRVTVYK